MESYHALRLRIREGAQQHCLYRTEHRRVHPNTKREHNYSGGGERRGLRQHASAKAQVLPELLDTVPPPNRATVLPLQGHIAELPARQYARFLLVVARVAELIDFFGHMLRHLLGHLALHSPSLQPPG